LTFLRFFEVFAGASELVVAALFFEDDLLFGALVSDVALLCSGSLGSVILTGEAPFDRRAASVIKLGKWMSEPVLFLEIRRLMCATTGVSSRTGAPNRAKKVEKR
jgi:hypothetical protein